MNQSPIICTRCKIPMNHHAEKLVDPRNTEDALRATASFPGAIEEVHACPNCGALGARAGA